MFMPVTKFKIRILNPIFIIIFIKIITLYELYFYNKKQFENNIAI